MKEAPWRNPETLKMQESVASGKSISMDSLPAAGPMWITAGGIIDRHPFQQKFW